MCLRFCRTRSHRAGSSGGCCRGTGGCPRAPRAAIVATASVEGYGMARGTVASEVESNLHHAPGRGVDRWKRPLLGRLNGEALEIPARPSSIQSGGIHRTVLGDDDSHPHFDMSADGSM